MVPSQRQNTGNPKEPTVPSVASNAYSMEVYDLTEEILIRKLHTQAMFGLLPKLPILQTNMGKIIFLFSYTMFPFIYLCDEGR